MAIFRSQMDLASHQNSPPRSLRSASSLISSCPTLAPKSGQRRRSQGARSIVYASLLIIIVSASLLQVKKRILRQQIGIRTVHQKKEERTTTTPHSLRFDWTNLPPISDLARSITAFQTRCAKSTEAKVWNHLKGGIGQNLHTWALALCSSMDLHKAALVTGGKWTWASCDETGYPMLCYFGKEHLAEGCDENIIYSWNISKKEPSFEACPNFIGKGVGARGMDKTVHEFMGPAMEYLFQSVSPAVILNAEKQAMEAFPDGLPDPADLITVHIRWGDKKTEVPNLPISSYIESVGYIVNNRPPEQQSSDVHIYLASEDPDALARFIAKCPKHWKIHMSGPTQSQDNNRMMDFASGLTGLESMGALLLSLQANNYVLATTSNWSRLINELREYIVHPRCNGCTRIIDLQEGQWPNIDFATQKNGDFFGSYFGQPTNLTEKFQHH